MGYDTYTFKRSAGKKQKGEGKTQQCLDSFYTTYTLFSEDYRDEKMVMCFRRDYGTYYGKGTSIATLNGGPPVAQCI